MATGPNWSPDASRAGAGRPVRGGPGQLQRAADRMRGRRMRQGQQGAAAGRQQAQKPQHQQLGSPDLSPAPGAEERPTGDWRHVQMLAQHDNISRLGREMPFGHWATLNGEFRALQQQGQVPFDIFEDVT